MIRWWRLFPFLIVLLALLAISTAALIPRKTAPPPALVGSQTGNRMAPNFRLTDQFGREVSLAQFRGRPVALTFVGATCTQTCPLVAAQLRRTITEMGAPGKRVALVAVSTEPEQDTRAAIVHFSRKYGLLHRWSFLTASRAQLAPIWREYYVYAAPANAPANLRDAHTTVTFLIDTTGRERVLMGGDPALGDLQRDLSILLGLPPKPVGAFAVPAPQAGHPAPALALRTLAGQQVNLRSLRGHTVLLNFFATWCLPCNTEAPRLAAWYRRLHPGGFVVLGVDQLEGRTDVQRFAQRHHLTYPIAIDGDGSVSAAYDVSHLPISVVIDPQGTVVSVQTGVVTDRFLTAHVLPLLSKTA